MKRSAWSIVGYLTIAFGVLLGSALIAFPAAIQQIAGLAVAQSGTAWNQVRDAAVGDNLVDGVLSSALSLYDSANNNFDRARGSTTNGLQVDVTRAPGSNQTPADNFANPNTFQGTWALLGLFDGTTWDRWRGQVSPTQAGTNLVSETVSAADTALTKTLTGVAGTAVHIYKARMTCVPSGSASATIVDGVTTIYAVSSGNVPQGPVFFEESWNPGLTITTGATATITITTCGAGNVSVLTLQADQF